MITQLIVRTEMVLKTKIPSNTIPKLINRDCCSCVNPKKSTNQRRGAVNAFGSTIGALYGAMIPNPAKSRTEVPRNKRNKNGIFIRSGPRR